MHPLVKYRGFRVSDVSRLTPQTWSPPYLVPILIFYGGTSTALRFRTIQYRRPIASPTSIFSLVWLFSFHNYLRFCSFILPFFARILKLPAVTMTLVNCISFMPFSIAWNPVLQILIAKFTISHSLNSQYSPSYTSIVWKRLVYFLLATLIATSPPLPLSVTSLLWIGSSSLAPDLNLVLSPRKKKLLCLPTHVWSLYPFQWVKNYRCTRIKRVFHPCDTLESSPLRIRHRADFLPN